MLFSVPDNDVTSPIVQKDVATNTKTMNLILANCSLVVFRQSSNVHHSDSHLSRKSQEEANLRRADCHVEQTRPIEADTSSIAQYFSKLGVSAEERQQEPNSSSGEILLDIKPSLPVIRKQGFLNGPQCEEMLKDLELLRDNGEFEHHQRKFNSFLRRYGEKGNKDMEVYKRQIPNGDHCNEVVKKFFQEKGTLKEDDVLFSTYSRLCTKKGFADMELALIIEQGISFMYKRQLSKSKRYFTSVIKLAEHCKLRNPSILIARAYFLLGRNCSCKKPENFSTFLECLSRSEYLLQNHESPEDSAELYHTLGSFWLAYMSKIPEDERNTKTRKEIKEKAKTYYERAIEICKKDSRSRIRNKRLTYCHLSFAAILLDCSSTVARTRKKLIPADDVKVAKRHLDIVEYELDENIPRGTRVQILKRRSDQYYRQGPEMYQLAKETAQDALQMTDRHGFNTELKSLQERIDFLAQLCEDTLCRERIKLLADGDPSTSGSDSRFETSCSESDENQNSP